MPFIGKQPEVGAYQLIDAITTSATATYALAVGGTAYFPASARNLIVSLNGITQAPESAYTVSGSNIVFDSALTSSDVIDYILVIGDAVDIGTPSDGTVGTAQMNYPLGNFSSTGIDDNATSTAMTVTSGGLVGIGATSVDSYNQFKVQTSSAVAGEIIEATGSNGYSATTWKTDGGNWQVGLRHDKAGDLIFRNATSGVIPVKIDDEGIKFFNDTATANALDDYEEGTWTPQMLGYAQSTPATQTYSAQEGHYVKIGRLVVASYAVQLSNKGNMSGNYVLLSGWPFSRESANFDCGIANFLNMSTSVNSMWWELTNSYGWLSYISTSGNTTAQYMTVSGLNNNTRFSGSVAYLIP